MDHAHLLAPLESRVGRRGEPIASRPRLGWIIRGVINGCIAVTADLVKEIRRFCDTEDFGTEFQSGCLSADNQRAMRIVQEKTQRLVTSYELPIIWREGEPDLVNNRQMAENRFRSLLRRFERDPAFARDYHSSMQKNFDQGYA